MLLPLLPAASSAASADCAVVVSAAVEGENTCTICLFCDFPSPSSAYSPLPLLISCFLRLPSTKAVAVRPAAAKTTLGIISVACGWKVGAEEAEVVDMSY